LATRSTQGRPGGLLGSKDGTGASEALLELELVFLERHLPGRKPSTGENEMQCVPLAGLKPECCGHKRIADTAAYRCVNGHVVDPATTRQRPVVACMRPKIVGSAEAATLEFRCLRCVTTFTFAR
jgi:hypothetical protein